MLKCHLQHLCRHPRCIFIFKKCKSSETTGDKNDKLQRVRRIKRYNLESKVLFGSIVQTHKTEEPVKIVPPESEVHKKSESKLDLNIVENIKEEKLRDTSGRKTKSSLNAILTFPLTDTEGVDFSISDSVQVDLDVKVPSVTRILQGTMPPERRAILDRWEREMIRKLGQEGFQQYKTETFKKGHTLHSSIECLLRGTPPSEIEVDAKNEGHWKSLEAVFPDVSEVQMLEATVQHPQLHYLGIFDCLAKYKDSVCIIDWKTSQKPKQTIGKTYDNPLQIAAYIGAANANKDLNIQVDSGCIVVAYENGDPAHCHFMDPKMCSKFWYQWLRRLHKYWNTRDSPNM